MIEAKHDVVRSQRRIMSTIYPMGEDRRRILLSKPVGEVFTTTYFYNHKDFWNKWAGGGINHQLKSLKIVAAQVGAQSVGEFLNKGFDELCKAAGSTVKDMALLCDFATAFDLEFPGAPSAIPAATPAPAQAAS